METFMLLVSAFMSMMVVPHMLKMIGTGSSRDQSALGVFGVAMGIVCWILYGIQIGDMTIVISNLIMLTTYVGYFGTILFYRASDVSQRSTDTEIA